MQDNCITLAAVMRLHFPLELWRVDERYPGLNPEEVEVHDSVEESIAWETIGCFFINIACLQPLFLYAKPPPFSLLSLRLSICKI
jgi:hypothetical protein